MESKRALLSACLWACKRAPNLFEMYPEVLATVKELHAHGLYLAANLSKVSYETIQTLERALHALHVTIQDELYTGSEVQPSLQDTVEEALLERAEVQRACRTNSN